MLPTSRLRYAVARYSRPTDASLDRLEAAATARSLSKGDHLLREGEVATHVAFVEAGLLRYYYLAEGREHTGQFFFPGQFVTDVASFVRRRPALQNVDALEPTRVRLIARADLDALYDADPAFERFGRRLFQDALASSQLRTASLLRDSAEDRYLALLDERPKVMGAVPLQTVASYLGVTPEALSRIRRRVAAGSG